AHTGGGGELILGPVALEYLADLEQRDVGEAAVGVLLRAGHESRNEARPHVGEVRRDRIGERDLRLSAAEQLGLAPADERPRNRLDHRAAGQCTLGLAVAQL